MRHPDKIMKWTHHEKCVIIDQKIAYFGGIDLCFGRWDTKSHLLVNIYISFNLYFLDAFILIIFVYKIL